MDLHLFITPKVVGQFEIMNNDQNSNLTKDKNGLTPLLFGWSDMYMPFIWLIMYEHIDSALFFILLCITMQVAQYSKQRNFYLRHFWSFSCQPY